MHLKESMQKQELFGTEGERRLEVTIASAQGSIFLLHIVKVQKFIGKSCALEKSHVYYE